MEESRGREDGNAQHTPIETDSIGLTMEPLLNVTTESVLDDRNVTQAVPPTTELANREKGSDGRRVKELVNVNDSRFRQSGGAYNKDRNRQRVDVFSQRSQQHVKEIGEMGRKLSEIKRSSNATISNLHQEIFELEEKLERERLIAREKDLRIKTLENRMMNVISANADKTAVSTSSGGVNPTPGGAHARVIRT